LSAQLLIAVFVVKKFCLGIYEKAIVFSALFCIATYFYGHYFPGFPWTLPGYVWNCHEIFLQTLSIWGVYGLNYITIVIASFGGVACVFYETKDKKNMLIASSVSLFLFFFIVIFGLYRLHFNKTEYTNYRARIVQCNISQIEKMNHDLSLQNLKKHIAYSKHDSKMDFIIWPEAAIPYLYHEEFSQLHEYLKSPLKIGEYLISGAVRKDLPTANIHNSAVIIDHLGRNVCNYDKVRLVLFGEYIPFRKYIPFQSIASDIGDFDVGRSPSVIEIKGLKIIMAICYEAAFPSDLIIFQKKRADIIINLTNDAWFGFTSEPFQHLQIVRARAIECGLPLIRSTNYGISAAFDPYGREIKRIPINCAGFMDCFIPRKISDTPYNRLGDSVFFFFIMISLIYSFRRFETNIPNF
jgi:apolipoprotein N-acyltransferase